MTLLFMDEVYDLVISITVISLYSLYTNGSDYNKFRSSKLSRNSKF